MARKQEQSSDLFINESAFAICVAFIIVISSVISILYRKYKDRDLTNLYIEDIIIPQKGLQLWFDCSDKSNITFVNDDDKKDVLIWESKVNDIRLTADLAAGIGRNPERSYIDAKYPQYHQAQNLNTPSIFFDYEHTATFNKKFEIQTIISLHSFEKDNGIKHEEIHGYHYDSFENFYIFTSNKQCHFHGHSKKLFSNAAFHAVKNGKIRLDGNQYDENVNNVKKWEGGDVRIAVLECTNIVNGMNRIGADRKNHHFAGSIVELIVYNRKLNQQEKQHVVKYLINKYYYDYHLSLTRSLALKFSDHRVVDVIIDYLLESSILSVLSKK